jgi:hypothetical protein
VPSAPEYIKRGKFGIWDRIKAALGGARYNAQGGLPGMIGGALGGAVRPEEIDQANFITGPYAQWRRQVEEARAEDDRNFTQAEKYLRLAKMVEEVNRANAPKPLKHIAGMPNLTFQDEDSDEIVMPRGAHGQPIPTAATVTAENNHEFQLQKLEDQQRHQLEMLEARMEAQLELLGARGVQSHQLEQFRQQGRVAIQRMRERHQREMIERRRGRRK